MMNQMDRDDLLNILDVLVNELGLCNFFTDDRRTKTHDLYDWAAEHNLAKRFNMCVATGATKGVLVFDDRDWVIKFRLTDADRDYCRKEYENYVRAEDAGLSYYFAETVYLCEYHGVEFYAQENVECDESVESQIVDSLQRSYDEDGTPYDVEDLWNEAEDMDACARVHYLYDDDDLVKFINDNHINDLHSGNFGTKGDHYVIIDFSGFGRAVWGE